MKIYDGKGKLYGEYGYTAWGKCRIKTNINGIGEINPFRYRGYYYDEEISLYYLNARYYDPEIGRFISADRIEYLSPESINGLNLYAYCGNNPVMNVDPSGTFSWKGLGKILASIAIVAAVAVVVAVTAGAAGAAIAGAAGFSALGAEVVGVTVGTATFLSGVATGTGEIVNQINWKGAENINLGSIAILTASGALDGALLAGALFTGTGGTAVIWHARMLWQE